MLDADKIQVGTLRVGGGGSKPGQLGVFDASNSLVAWAGTNGGYYGLWGKQLWVGGTSPADAPLSVDGSGNIVIQTVGGKYATFSLNTNGVTTDINNATWAPSGLGTGLTVRNNSTGRIAAVAPDQIALYNGSVYRVTIGQSATNSAITLDGSGLSYVLMGADSSGCAISLVPFGASQSAYLLLGQVTSLPLGALGKIVMHSGILKWHNGSSWQNAGGTGTVTSVALTLPSEFSISGSPVTTSGNLTGSWSSQTANRVLASPNGSFGTPAFRALVAADLPSNLCTTDTSQTISATKTLSGTLDVHGGSGIFKIRQRSDSNGVPSMNNNELCVYFDTGLGEMCLAYRDSFGSSYRWQAI